MLYKAKAYTLIELLVVIAIVGLLAGFGIPAFAKFGRNIEANQKAEEIRELFYQARSLAYNPENTAVTSYRVYYDTSSADKPKYQLKACKKVGSDNCGAKETLKEIGVLKGESVTFTTNDGSAIAPSDVLVEYPTEIINGRVRCVPNQNITDPINMPPYPQIPEDWEIVMFTDYDPGVYKKFILRVHSDPYRSFLATEDIS